MALQASPKLDILLRRMLEQVRDYAIVLLETDGRVIGWYGGSEETFGYTVEEAIGQPSSFLFTEEDIRRGIPEHELQVARAEGRAEDDRYQRRKDGAHIWVFGVLVALRDNAGELLGFAKILRNRSDIRQRIDELENRVEELRRAGHRKDVFLSTLAHELRNPLAPLVNAIELINLTEAPSSGLEYPIRLIERQVTFIRRLVDDLLDLTRIGTGKLTLQIEDVDILSVLNHAADAVRACVDERRHTLAIFTPPAAPIVFRADPSRLNQVFVNLLQNACTYTPPGGKIWVNATVENDEVVVRVRDTGIGIPPEMQERIFDLFTQAEAPPYGGRGGLGIGLALTKQMVTMHGGSVQVLSGGIGHGSEFIVRLPLRPDPALLQRASRSAAESIPLPPPT